MTIDDTIEILQLLEESSAEVDEAAMRLDIARATRDAHISIARSHGLSLRAIADLAGVSHTAVEKILKTRPPV